jgi:ribosomal protein S3
MIDYKNQVINFKNPKPQSLNVKNVFYDILKSKENLLEAIEIFYERFFLKKENNQEYYHIILKMKRPGYFIGKRGKTMEEITKELENILKKPVKISISDR